MEVDKTNTNGEKTHAPMSLSQQVLLDFGKKVSETNEMIPQILTVKITFAIWTI